MSEATRMQTPDLLPDDEFDRSLRPRRLADFVGQPAVKDQLAVAIASASWLVTATPT